MSGGLHAMRTHRRVLTASLVGTAVEFYDFYIYATAASLVFGPLFFPAASPAMQLLSSYATMAVAFFARPLGAIVFGHFGDRIGRKSTLVASLLLMGGSTVAIAFLPTYHQAGWLAPALLCVLRFGQGFGLGGGHRRAEAAEPENRRSVAFLDAVGDATAVVRHLVSPVHVHHILVSLAVPRRPSARGSAHGRQNSVKPPARS